MGLVGMNLKNEILSNYSLTQREMEILDCILQGYDKKEISKILFLSYHTINTHYKHIFIKMQIHSISELVLKVFEYRNN